MSAADEQLDRLGAAVREALPSTTPDQRARQRAAFVDAEPSPRAGLSSTRVGLAGLVAAAVGAIVWLSWASWPTAESDVVALRSMTPDSSTLVGAFATTRLERDSVGDGSLSTEPEPKPSGSEAETVVLESGRIEAEAGARRRIVAGPYVVSSGPEGSFELEWDAERETLILEVDGGEVSVVGASSQHVVVAGDRARGTASEFVVVHTSATKHASRAVETKPTASPWVRAAKRGEYRDALRLATAAGALKKLATLDRAELKLLADAARLGGGADQSEQVLLELRRRFAKSTEAKRAAFYLGRFSERAGRYDDAVTWYREYLASSKRGSFAAQARGRLVKVLSRDGSSREAVAAAREYLEHHPNGAYASLATRLAGDGSGTE